MTSINPIAAFKGIKNALNKLGKNKKMTAQMEQIAGLTRANQVKDSTVLKEIVLKETALGHNDFVKGLLSSEAAKNLYKK
ncbi:hypothetical protein EGQ24_08100 [bacterium]|nr:hypothetical protein [bacterium]